MVDYVRVIAEDHDLIQLQAEINTNISIVPSCVGVTETAPTTVSISFAAALSVDEEAALDGVVSRHAVAPRSVPVNSLPVSRLDGYKIAVHSSSKPDTNVATYAMWTGSGDDLSNPNDVGGGEMLSFQFTQGDGKTSITKDLEFNETQGKVWIHEAYLKFDGGGPADYVEGMVYAKPTELQTSVNLDLEIADGKWIIPAPNGAGTGTHGFADPAKIRLIPRSFSQDGHWDYDDVNGLRPNLNGTGGFKLSTEDTPVHKYYNKIPCFGTCNTYFTMSSDDTAFLPPGYFVRIIAHNKHDNTWNASVIVEVYRERTLNP